MSRPITPGGKPMRALRILAAATTPLTEVDVWRLADEGMVPWHQALAKLGKLGYATNDGRRVGRRWTITDKGRQVLTETEAKETP